MSAPAHLSHVWRRGVVVAAAELQVHGPAGAVQPGAEVTVQRLRVIALKAGAGTGDKHRRLDS
jgi:hypothetical protein